MNTEKIITKRIGHQLDASVLSTTPDTKLVDSLWAINWFDLRRKWMYSLYNMLVVGHVQKIGAKPIFKGELQRPIHNSERLRRDMLLIVRYPKASAFLEMISSYFFQVKGMLRSSAVEHFQFGFMSNQRLSSDEQDEAFPTAYKGKLKYLVQVCEGSDAIDLDALIEAAKSREIFPHFIGKKSAILGLKKNEASLKTLDFILSHVLVLGGFDDEALESFAQSAEYQKFFNSSSESFCGLYERTI
ncbi:MAG: hypothetical protein ABJF11_03900 [Reichenbachiella sp.]|uniref:hypothetical protein n=1 Tax=Reichenbachiella sp. TaxID=2184521 RepID=UPI003264EA01